MPGPQTQHKGTVYGDDENAPKPGLGPPVRRRPQHAHRRTSRSHPPRGMTAPRARPARRCAYAWGAGHVDTMTELELAQVVAHVRSYPSTYLLTTTYSFEEEKIALVSAAVPENWCLFSFRWCAPLPRLPRLATRMEEVFGPVSTAAKPGAAAVMSCVICAAGDRLQQT